MFAAPPPVPTAIAFRDAADGVLGTTRTLELTADGGRTWRVVLHAPRPVASVGIDAGGRLRAVLDDGENLGSAQGLHWAPVAATGSRASPCPAGMSNAAFSGAWVLCTGELGAGAGGKAVYHLTAGGWRRVAYTPFPGPGHAYGGISVTGYAMGIAMAPDGFGVIWESRGTLYVTRDGGSHWTGLPKVAEPEVDFGESACALPGGVAYVLLARGNVHGRLLETSDAGRTWHVVHRWG